MCAIIDSDVVREAFGTKRTEAGIAFLNAVENDGLRLMVGGQLLKELDKNVSFKKWRQVAMQYGVVQIENKAKVEALTEELTSQKRCKSNDQHIVALAQLSGARLLFSNDLDLHKDFGSSELINNPRGKVFSTRKTKSLTNAHKGLLRDTTLCRKIVA